MNKKLLALALFALVALSAFVVWSLSSDGEYEPSAPVMSASDDPIGVMRIVEIHSDESHPSNIGHRTFIDLAYANSDGSLRVEMFSGGWLSPTDRELMAQVQMGIMEIMRIPAPIIASVEPRFHALSLPGVWDSREAMFAALDGEVGAFFADMLRAHDLYILAWHDAGARSLYNAVRPIYTPEDLAGLRIRVQEVPLMSRLIELMGGIPVPLGPAEVYHGIQAGRIDSAEANWWSYVNLFEHYEVARYFTENEHVRVPDAVIISLDVWNGLTPNQQEVLRAAAIEGANAQRAAWAAAELAAEERAVAAGTVVVRLTPAQRQAFTDRIVPIWDDFPQYRLYIDMIRAAQA